MAWRDCVLANLVKNLTGSLPGLEKWGGSHGYGSRQSRLSVKNVSAVNGLILEDFVQRLENVIVRGSKLRGQTPAAELFLTPSFACPTHVYPPNTQPNPQH